MGPGSQPLSASSEVRERFLEIADVMMIAIDATGGVTYTNAKARDVLGYEQGTLVGEDWFDMCIPDRVQEEVRGVFDRLMAGEIEADERHENPVVTADGEERIIEWHNTVLHDEEGRITGTLSSGQDVTERRQTEKRLEEERKKYRTLVEQFPNGLVTLFDQEHRYQIVGGRTTEERGVSAEEIEGQQLSDVFPPENVEILEPLYDGVFEGESGTVDVEFAGRVFRVRVVPVRDEEGNVFAGMTISQDVTDQKARSEKLAAAKKRYRMLLQAVPDPVFVGDAETGEIREVNEAAERFRGQPSEELVGSHQTSLHPADETEKYRQTFKKHVVEGGQRRYLEDGSQIYAVTGNGQRVPVEISVETVDFDGETLICGIFHDISAHLEYEHALKSLNETTRSLFAAEDPSEIASRTIESVRTIFEQTGAAVFLLDEQEGVLRPIADAIPPDWERGDHELPVFEPGESALWQVLTDGETAVFDEDRADTHRPKSEPTVRSTVVVPLGGYGVLVAERRTSDGFEDRAVSLLETLGATAEAALDRTAREQILRDRERRYEKRTKELEELESINAQIRNVARVVVNAETRQDVEQAVCEELVDSEPIAFAWIGDIDPIEQSLVPRTWAGSHEGYLEEIERSLDEESVVEPAVRVARTREPVVVSNTAAKLSQEAWRDCAIRRSFQSVLSIPLLYQETFQGVLTVYATEQAVFSETLQSVFNELGELIANAEVAIERRDALLSSRATELTFKIKDPTCFFLRFTQETSCTLELEEVVAQSDSSWLVFVTVSGKNTADLVEAAQRAPEVGSARPVRTDGESLVQFRFNEPFIVSRLADRGISVRDITADGSKCRVTVRVPPSASVHRTVDTVSSLYPDSELVSKHDQVQSPAEGQVNEEILERLTDRQREIVTTAYRRGYFEDPRNVSGKELAEDLGLSSSAFHRHLRAVERKTFGVILDNDSNTPASSTVSRQE